MSLKQAEDCLSGSDLTNFTEMLQHLQSPRNNPSRTPRLFILCGGASTGKSTMLKHLLTDFSGMNLLSWGITKDTTHVSFVFLPEIQEHDSAYVKQYLSEESVPVRPLYQDADFVPASERPDLLLVLNDLNEVDSSIHRRATVINFNHRWSFHAPTAEQPAAVETLSH